MKNVVIADEHYIIREALKRVLTDFNIVGEAEGLDVFFRRGSLEPRIIELAL